MTATPRTHFLCCIPLEGAVTALGYFDASLSVVGVFFFFRMFIYRLFYVIPYGAEWFSINHFVLTYIGYMWGWLLGLALCLLFAVYLIVGVNKRRPGYVLSYLVFAILKAIALTAYLAVQFTDPFHYFFFLSPSLYEIIIALLLYLLCLVMIYFVYCNIKMEKEPHSMIYNILQDNHTSDIKKDVV